MGAEITQTIQQLEPKTRYIFRVRAINQFGRASGWSEAVEYETAGDNAPTNGVDFTPGTGLSLDTQQVLSVGAGNGIQVNTDTIQISPVYTGQTSISVVGTIGTGSWQGVPIGVTYGGTGTTSYTTGDILYAGSSSTLLKLAAVATGNVMLSGGIASPSTWGKVDVAQHITGVIALNNGGSNSTAAQLGTANKFLVYDGTRITASAYDQNSFSNTAYTDTAVAAEAATRLAADLAINRIFASDPDGLLYGATPLAVVASTATVEWPDGSPGTFTVTSVDGTWSSISGYTITYGSPVTKTYTQSTITRDSTSGVVTNRPKVTVA